LSLCLSLHNAIAVIQGLKGKKSSFVRTPKFNIRSVGDSLVKSKYRSAKISPLTLLEGLLALYFFFAVVYGITQRDSSLLLFHVLLFFGYATIFYFSVKHLNYKTANH